MYARRILGRSVTFFTLGDGDDSRPDVEANAKEAVPDAAVPALPQAILSAKRVDFDADAVRELARLAAPGSKIRIRGTIETHERGWPIVVCHDIMLMRCAPLAASVRRLLTAVETGLVLPDVAAAALLLNGVDSLPAPARDSMMDDALLEEMSSALRSAAPAGAAAAANGVRPPAPSATLEAASLGSLLSPDGSGMRRVREALESAGGVDAARAAVASEEAIASSSVLLEREESEGHRCIVCAEGEVRAPKAERRPVEY